MKGANHKATTYTHSSFPPFALRWQQPRKQSSHHAGGSRVCAQHAQDPVRRVRVALLCCNISDYFNRAHIHTHMHTRTHEQPQLYSHAQTQTFSRTPLSHTRSHPIPVPSIDCLACTQGPVWEPVFVPVRAVISRGNQSAVAVSGRRAIISSLLVQARCFDQGWQMALLHAR